MFTHLKTRAARYIKNNPTLLRYAADGLLVSSAVNIIANNNNLFATRLGADDYQLSLLQFIPQAVNMLVLIPGGLVTDALRNKRAMVTGSLLLSALLYALIGFTPIMPVHTLYGFVTFLSLVTGTLMLYNLSWQSYFPEVVSVDTRNRVLTLRTQVSVFVGMCAPLLTGAILACIGTTDGKIMAHQGFFFAAAVLVAAASFNFRRFNAVRPVPPKRFTLLEIKKAGRSLLHNKTFIGFAGTALFFYFTWQMDWTLYYIGQVQYLHMNEFQLGLAVVGATGIQFLTLRFWSRKNERHGVVLPVAFGILGLSLCPLSMIGAVSLPAAIGPYAFLVFNTIANTAFVTISLNMFQCLLQVLDEEYRSLSISIYTCLTCFSNAVMPVAGVALYKTLGGDLNGLRNTFWIVFVLRIVAAGLWLLRWRRTAVKAT